MSWQENDNTEGYSGNVGIGTPAIGTIAGAIPLILLLSAACSSGPKNEPWQDANESQSTGVIREALSSGETCQPHCGRCVIDPTSVTNCSQTCVDTACGDGDRPCSTCPDVCPPHTANCDGSGICTNLLTDSNNCGRCNHPCPGGFCQNGTCVCLAANVCGPDCCAPGQQCCLEETDNGSPPLAPRCVDPVPMPGRTWCGKVSYPEVLCNNCAPGQTCASIPMPPPLISDELYCQ
jgi:hypothetical protein